MTPRYLVVAATTAEAAHVPADLALVITGMGKTAAAVATARALATYDNVVGLTILNIGSAGALRPGLSGIHEPGVVLNHDLSADLVRALGHDPQERLDVGESEIVLATGDVFVSDPMVRDRLAERAHLVDMEGYAVAYAAREAGVPGPPREARVRRRGRGRDGLAESRRGIRGGAGEVAAGQRVVSAESEVLAAAEARVSDVVFGADGQPETPKIRQGGCAS